jgi:hypothetical protein
MRGLGQASTACIPTSALPAPSSLPPCGKDYSNLIAILIGLGLLIVLPGASKLLEVIPLGAGVISAGLGGLVPQKDYVCLSGTWSCQAPSIGF